MVAASKAVPVVPARSGHHFFGGENPSGASGTARFVPTICHDGGGVQRHGLCCCLVTMSHPIAVDTVDVIVWAVSKIGSIQLMFAFGAGETFFVIGAGLGDLFFCVKYHALAPWASIS